MIATHGDQAELQIPGLPEGSILYVSVLTHPKHPLHEINRRSIHPEQDLDVGTYYVAELAPDRRSLANLADLPNMAVACGDRVRFLPGAHPEVSEGWMRNPGPVSQFPAPLLRRPGEPVS